ncbi:hypothetical protein BX600DRAFT_89622 [Xylariales sp. PMI_506]|nr:hypothetical protein BX600DRAFT_89622 [Xylariales sp. PMI_506]
MWPKWHRSAEVVVYEFQEPREAALCRFDAAISEDKAILALGRDLDGAEEIKLSRLLDRPRGSLAQEERVHSRAQGSPRERSPNRQDDMVNNRCRPIHETQKTEARDWLNVAFGPTGEGCDREQLSLRGSQDAESLGFAAHLPTQAPRNEPKPYRFSR